MSNRSRSLAFRELVAFQFQIDGLADVSMKPMVTRRAFGSALAAEESQEEAGDIRNLPGSFLLNTRNELERALSVALDEAERERIADGKKRAAVAWHRPGREVADAYVVMTLATFSGLLVEHGELVS